MPAARFFRFVPRVSLTRTRQYWNPAVAHVKVVQFWAVCVRVHLFCTVHGIDVDRVPIVFCGDLNSLPDSGVVALALGGALPVRNVARSLALSLSLCDSHPPPPLRAL